MKVKKMLSIESFHEAMAGENIHSNYFHQNCSMIIVRTILFYFKRTVRIIFRICLYFRYFLKQMSNFYFLVTFIK